MNVRRITWTVFILGILAVLMVGRVPLAASLIVGGLGLVISVIALLTSKD